MATIDLSNYTTSLFLASSNSFTDGNVYFDYTTGTVDYGDSTDYPTLDLTSHGGGATDPNPLSRDDGLKLEALYAFETRIRRLNPTRRPFARFTHAKFRDGGAFSFVNGRAPLNDATRNMHRGSGWDEKTGDTINRIYFNVKGLGQIDSASNVYYQTSQFGTAVDYSKAGNVDQAIQVYGDASNGDFDNRFSSHYLSVRTYGNNYDRIDTSGTLGISKLGGFSTGAALNEDSHLTTSEATYPLADVYTSPISPWDQMSLEKLATPSVQTGFAGPDGSFTWVVRNPAGGSLNQVIAFLDAVAQADAVVTTGEALLNGKQYNTWYKYSPTGKITPVSGEGNTLGVFIEGLSGTDLLRLEYVDDSQTTCVYPIYTPVTVEIGQGAIDDPLAWFHAFHVVGYNTAGYVEYEDASGNVVSGDADSSSPFISGSNTFVSFQHDFTTDGSVDVIFICDGDGGVAQSETIMTLADTTVKASCIPPAEANM